MASELAATWDLTVLRYSRVAEDHRVAARALQINPEEDVVLSITSAGDNVLNLLLERPQKIVAIDISLAQNSLLELKIAAISHLRYQDFLSLLGESVDEPLKRVEHYELIRKHLPEYAKNYWDSHTDLIKSGLGDSSRFEKYLTKYNVQPISEMVNPDLLKKFFEAEDLRQQRKLFEQLPLQKVQAILRELVQKQMAGRSPAQVKYVDCSDEEMFDLIWRRFCALSRNVPIRDNFYFSLFMRGKRSSHTTTPDYLLPPFLTERGFQELKTLVTRIEVHTGSVQDYLTSSSAKIHKICLSDIFEYMSTDHSNALFSLLSQKMVKGGCLVYWNLFADRYPPDGNSTLEFQKQLSLELRKIDRSFCFEVCALKNM